MANERVLIDDLELGEIDIYKDAMYEDKPFTGIAVDDDDGIHTEWTFVDGNGHGRWFSLFPNGQLQEEIILDHGEVISERIWNKDGGLIHRMDSSPLLEQDFDNEGNLLNERTVDYLRTFYVNGIKKADYDYLSSSVTEFDHSGNWIIKGKLTDGYLVLSRENIEFNDNYWTEKFISILKDSYEDFHPYFRIWFEDKSGIQSKIICEMIENKDLRLKYDGMLLAREYELRDAIPLIEKQITINKRPPSTENTGYGITVGHLAERVLRDLG